MPVTVQISPVPQATDEGQGASASSPLFLLVFGFVFLVMLQAWFVRRITQLTACHKAHKNTYCKLATEAADLAEEVSGLERARQGNAASIAGLERESQETQARIDAFIEEHGDQASDHKDHAAVPEEPSVEPGTAPDRSVTPE